MNVEATFSDLFLGGGGFGGKFSYISDGFVLFNSRNKTEMAPLWSKHRLMHGAGFRCRA